jgi:O-antigen/teichoic acid export membrane protein
VSRDAICEGRSIKVDINRSNIPLMPPIKALTLRQNFSWTFVGNIVYAAAQWGMLVVLAKLGSPEMVGQFTLGLAITAPIILLANLQLRQIQTTDVDRKYQFGDYLGLRLICVSLAAVAILIVTLVAGYRWETSLVILVIGLSKIIESISDLFHGLFQYHERMDRIAISLMIKGPLSLLVLGIGIKITGTVLGGSIGLVVVWALVLIFYDIPNAAAIFKDSASLQRQERADILEQDRSLLPRFKLKDLRSLVGLSLPLGFVMMLISLNANIPRYFIEHNLGERELGIFSALSYLMVAGNIVIGALGQSASPRLAKYYAAGNKQDFKNLFFKTIWIGALLGGISIVMAAIAGKEILTILYRPEYARYAYLFILLMVAAGIGYISSFMGYAMTSAQYFRVQMPLCLVTTGVSALCCLWLIPRQGLIGAAIALIVSITIQIIFSIVIIFDVFKKIDKSRHESGSNSLE